MKINFSFETNNFQRKKVNPSRAYLSTNNLLSIISILVSIVLAYIN